MNIVEMYLYTFYEGCDNYPIKIVAKNIEEAAKVFREMFNEKRDVIKVDNNGEVKVAVDNKD